MDAIQYDFHRSIELGDRKGMRDALEMGADLHYKEDHAVYLSAYYGQLDSLQFLQAAGLDIHQKNQSALFTAAYNGNIPIALYLLQNGGNIQTCYDENIKSPPLGMAIMGGHFEMVQFLVEQGVEIQPGIDFIVRENFKSAGSEQCVEWLKEYQRVQTERKSLLRVSAINLKTILQRRL